MYIYQLNGSVNKRIDADFIAKGCQRRVACAEAMR